MLSRPADLPSFDRPPVVETVLAVQFEPLTRVKVAHLGLLWNIYRESFPNATEHVPLEHEIEEFPADPARRDEVRVMSGDTFPVPRLSFRNDSGNEMIQVQHDRFAKNWRKTSNDEVYPRYQQTIRPQFDRDYERFVKFLDELELGTPIINQCEVVYVNHIVSGDEWQSHSDINKVITFWKNPSWPTDSLEDCGLLSRFIIRDLHENPVGRLIVEIQPALRNSDKRPMYIICLTARGIVGNGLDFLDLGREWIVRTFESITTSEMHRTWKRRTPC